MMSIHNGRDARQRRRAQFTKQAVDIRCNEVKMKVGIHLSEVRCLDVAPPKLWFWERDTTLEELRGARGSSIPVDLIDPSASPSRLKYEIAVRIRERIANRYDATATLRRERLINFSTIPHAHVPSPKATAACDPCVKTRQRHAADSHVPTQSASRVRSPEVGVSDGQGFHCRSAFDLRTQADWRSRLQRQ